MADNYLERKMEDMRRGTPAAPIRSSSGPRKGYIQFPFPPKKILLTGIASELALPIIRSFIKTGSKVAVADSDQEKGTLYAKNEGVRFHHLPNFNDGEIENAFDNLIKAWRDIDIIICTPRVATVLLRKWKEHLANPPIPRSYKGRLIIIRNQHEKGATADSPGDISMNEILLKESNEKNDSTKFIEKKRGDEIARLSLFLSLPDNDCISGNTINLL